MSQPNIVSDCWNQLYSDSEKLTKATSLQEVFTDEDISFIENRLKTILTRFLEKGELHKGIKIYIDKKLSNHYTEQMALYKPNAEESLENWCTSLFEDQKFGVVFNSLESYDNQLTERMCSIIQPLIEKAGIPLGGISFLFFMGNYGFTPFGIHKEAMGEEGFLFHMGPSNKTFYTWDIEELNAIEHNTEVFHNVDEMLPQSESYELKPKSVMFIPNYLYHIANTEEFSFSVVMDYINPSRNALELMIAKQITKEENDLSKSKSYVSPIRPSEKLDWNLILDRTTWEEKYAFSMKRHIARLQSNSGILLPAIKEYDNCIVTEEFSIKGKKEFSLVYYVDQNKQHYVMARGNEIPVKENVHLIPMLNDLNSGKVFLFEELKKELLGDWEIHHLYEFIDQLIKFSAIEKENQ